MRLTKGGADRLLALALGAAVGALRFGIGADRRDMDQSRNSRRRRGLGDAPGARDMDPVEIAPEDADQVDDRVGPFDGGGDRAGIAQSRAGELDLAEPAQGLEEESAARIALGDADPGARPEQGLGGIAADEAAAAEQGDQPVGLDGHGDAPRRSCAR